jgi:hypothetical protein
MLTNIIDDIRNLIGREIYFYVPTVSGCNSCSLDPITGESTNSYCTVCSGLYWITTYTSTAVQAHLTWGNMDNLQWPPGGQYFDGDLRAQIKYTADNYELVKTADYIVTDSVRMTVKNYALRGVPDLNRIVIILDQEEERT